jgi:hypothetical protein
MKMSHSSPLRASERTAPRDANSIGPATGIPFEDRLSGAVQCSVEVTACMVSVGVFAMILMLRFAAIFFVALLAVLFGRK